jgi:hypothetical protein
MRRGFRVTDGTVEESSDPETPPNFIDLHGSVKRPEPRHRSQNMLRLGGCKALNLWNFMNSGSSAAW